MRPKRSFAQGSYRLHLRSLFEIFLTIVAPKKMEETFVMNFTDIAFRICFNVTLVLPACERPSQMFHKLPHGEPLSIGEQALINEEYSVYATAVISRQSVAIAQDDAIIPTGTALTILPVVICQHFLENTLGQLKIIELGEVIDAEFPSLTAEFPVFLIEFLQEGSFGFKFVLSAFFEHF